jgi:hypothetical protein
MIIPTQCHFVEFLSKSPTNGRHLDLYTFFDFAASLFGGILTLGMGLNLFFWVRSRSRSHPQSALVWAALRKAALFFLISIAFNAAVWGVASGNVLDQDILLYFSLSLLFMPLLWRLRPAQLAAAAVAGIALSKGLVAVSPQYLVPAEIGTVPMEIRCMRAQCAPALAACRADPPCRAALRCAAELCEADEERGLEGVALMGCAAPCFAPPPALTSPLEAPRQQAPHVAAAARGKWDTLRECALARQCMPVWRYTVPEAAWARRLRNWLHQGHFSVLPWISFSIAGLAIAGSLFAQPNSDAVSRWRQRRLGWLALAFLAVSTAASAHICRTADRWRDATWVQCLDNVLSSTFEADEGTGEELFERAPDPTLLYFAWSLGWSFALLWLFEPLNRPRQVGPWLLRVVKYFSLLNRYLLSMYCLQIVVIIRATRIWSRWEGRGEWYYYEHPSLSPWVAAAIGIVYYNLAICIFWAWERYLRSVGTLEWIVRAVTGI